MCAEVCLLAGSGKEAEGLLLVTVFPWRCCQQTWYSPVLTQCPRLCRSKGTEKEHEVPLSQTLQPQEAEWGPEEEGHLPSLPTGSLAGNSRASLGFQVLAVLWVTLELCCWKQIQIQPSTPAHRNLYLWIHDGCLALRLLQFPLPLTTCPLYQECGYSAQLNSQVTVGMVAPCSPPDYNELQC